MVLIGALTFIFLLRDFPGISGHQTRQECESPQYVELGSTGSVRCNFHQLYAAYWYATTESSRDPPVIYYEDLKKSGAGLDNGEYDVHHDGSLIINNVTLRHDATFRVVFLSQKDGISSTENIVVVVTAHPDMTFPVITNCGGRKTCFKQLSSNTPVTCTVNNARPAVDLSWVKRTMAGDIPMSSSRIESVTNNLHTVVQTIDEISFNGNSLLLLICKSNVTPSLLLNNESVILLENPAHFTSNGEIYLKNAFYGSNLFLPCNVSGSSTIVWRKEDKDGRATLIAEAFQDKFPIANEYDTTSDGALVIRQIGLEHDGVYTCSHSDGFVEGVISYQVIINVRPVHAHPIIEECGQQRLCNHQLKAGYVLRCLVQDSRPPVNLGWYRRTTNGLEKLPSTRDILQEGELFSSSEDTTVTFNKMYISVLICQSLDETPLLSVRDSLIIVEDLSKNISYTNPVSRYVQEHSSLELDCSVKPIVYTLWKKKSKDGIYRTVLFESLGDKNTMQDNYYINSDHSLVVEDVSVKDEGIYVCLYGDGREEYEKSYNVIVYVDPEPNYLEVDGCRGQQYCVIKTQRQGNITCSVRGIRPAVDLELTTVEERQRDMVLFPNQKIFKSSDGKTFDVHVIASFVVNDLHYGRLTVACRTSGPNRKLFHLQTTLDLMITQGNNEETVSGSPVTWIVLSLLLVVIIFVAVFAIGIYFVCCKRKQKEDQEYHCNSEEELEMMPNSEDHPDGIVSGIHDDYKRSLTKGEKEKQFIKELKDKYTIWTSTIRPLPSYGRRLEFGVNEIFVDGGIKQLASRKKGMIQDEWFSVKSYHDIFTMNSRRIIIEGDPGFGKSTMMLKAAHDWIIDEPPLKDIEIFIFLQLSKLRGIKSLNKAIRKTLLPKESQLDERDIENLILGTEKVVIVLDDFDEYPDRESKKASDFMSIIAGEMLNSVKVILLTRTTTCVPVNFRPDTQFVRLNGFDRTAQNLYITKIFGSTETMSADMVKSSLETNSIMNDIARVPMFFAMFAHVENWPVEMKNLTSATTFFQCVIDQIESRLNEKVNSNDPDFGAFNEDAYLRLGEVALHALCDKKPLTWATELLMNKIGEDTCTKFLTVGILVQKDNGIMVTHTSNKMNQKEIKFHHKLFCEWYAAKFLVRRLEKRDYEKILNKMNPFDLQYLYRFTCGLNKIAANKIISYLQSGENGDKFAMICEIEKRGEAKDILEPLTEMCSSTVSIYGEGSRLLRKSTALLLEIASKHEVPIKSVLLDRCVGADDAYPEHLGVGPDSFLPSLITLRELRIYDVGRRLSPSLTDLILTYCSQCGRVSNLQFLKTFQPQVVLTEKHDVLRTLQPMPITVTWAPLKKGPEYLLDLQSGTWKDQENGREMTEDDHNSLLAEFIELWKYVVPIQDS